jgi:hypothetical protein
MFKKLFLAFVCSSVIISCNNLDTGKSQGSTVEKNLLPSSNGGRLDIMVIAEESLWQDSPGEIFRRYFTEAQDGLPQNEPIFNVRQVTPKQFGTMLQRSRNVVIIETGEQGFVWETDKYAKPQQYLIFSAVDKKALVELIQAHQEEAITQLHDSEMRYLQKRVTAKSQAVSKTLSSHNVSLKIPPAFEKTVEQEDLLVYWSKTLKTQQGLIIHFEPIPNNETALGSRIIPLRDSITKLHIPGDNEGSYMRVEDIVPPTFRNMKIDDRYTIETRGLWRTEGDFMGGAFLSYTIYDEPNNQKITVDGFLYAPEINKRNFVLEIEAVLRSIEFAK